MKILVFDPFCGASGDMILGSLIDLGADTSLIKNSLDALGWRLKLSISRVRKNGISATRVKIGGGPKKSSYKELVKIIKNSSLDEEVKRDSLSIFELLASAESKVHGVKKEEFTFHEIADSAADIVGVSTAIRSFMPSTIFSLPVSVGGGIVTTETGRIPVPAPATLEILNGAILKIQGGPVQMELLTPTGAALLAYFVRVCEQFYPQVRIEKTGYGAGGYELEIPNVLRVSYGESDERFLRDRIEVLETNVDDVTPEVIGNLVDELFSLGAKDVAVTPATMKKARSGHIIQVIAKPADSPKLIRKIIQETGTLGVRILPISHRLIALRKKKRVKIKIGGKTYGASVKIAYDKEGEILNIASEFGDAKRIATLSGIPVKDVISIIQEEAKRKFIISG